MGVLGLQDPIPEIMVMRRIMTFWSMKDRIYDGGPIRLYYNIIVLQLPTVISTVT